MHTLFMGAAFGWLGSSILLHAIGLTASWGDVLPLALAVFPSGAIIGFADGRLLGGRLLSTLMYAGVFSIFTGLIFHFGNTVGESVYASLFIVAGVAMICSAIHTHLWPEAS